MFAILGSMAISSPTGIDTAMYARVRPTSNSRHQLLALLPALGPLFPGGGLPRGAVVEVAAGPASGPGGGRATAGGASTLAFSLVAAATTRGSWCAAVGVADVGVLALAELGIDLDHLVLVPRPGIQWAQAAALSIDGTDAVVVCAPGRVRPELARRLSARVRDRRVALVVLSRHAPWPEGADFRLSVGTGYWLGAGAGHGHLTRRRVEVTVTGRRAAGREARAELWLPGPSGAPAP